MEEGAVTQRLDYEKLSAAGLRAFGGVYVYIVNSGLPKALIDLVFLRASQINGCANCLHMHTADARKAGETEERTLGVEERLRSRIEELLANVVGAGHARAARRPRPRLPADGSVRGTSAMMSVPLGGRACASRPPEPRPPRRLPDLRTRGAA